MPHELPTTGYVRLRSILGPAGPIPVSKSTWWAGVKSGRYPKPVKISVRITAWRVEDIRALIAFTSEQTTGPEGPARSNKRHPQAKGATISRGNGPMTEA